jgi:putative nucleotidyltransferase with HDIG domain
MFPDLQQKPEWLNRHNIIKFILLIISAVATCLVIIFPTPIRQSSYDLKIGDVADQDILATHSLSYISEVLTEQSRTDAEKSVPPVYLPSDPAITRRQLEALRNGLGFIRSVRFDSFASREQKFSDLSALSMVELEQDTMSRIVSLSDNTWQETENEALSVLEQVMRNTIRDSQVADYRRSVPTFISFTIPQEQSAIISKLVTPFVTANSLYSEEQTHISRQNARDSIQQVEKKFVQGEIIIRRGQIITPVTLEALKQFGLLRTSSFSESFLPAISLVTLCSAFICLYFTRRNISPMDDNRSLLLISASFIVFLFGARLLIPNRTIVPYLFPIPAFGLTITSLYSMEIGLIFSLVLSILTAFGLPNSLDLTIFYFMTSLCGILVLGKARRVGNFFWTGVSIGAAGCGVILAYRLPNISTDWFGIVTLLGVSFVNGLASASLTLIFQFLFSQLLGLTTALQLLEISRPDHPLLQFILRNAPGTYQHSLQVANLAEQAAEVIGADPLLVRVGALYHDAGKAMNPQYFIENQVPGSPNPHDSLDPYESAEIILEHVTEGVALGKKYRLPPRIIDFMREHHGTLLTRYQYARALENNGLDQNTIDVKRFRYPGPKPLRKETALLMLADGCEARARAEVPKNDDDLRLVVKKVFDFCQKEGQLDETTLTLRDLSRASESFVKTLRNTYHARIQYPEIKGYSSEEETHQKPANGETS